MLLTRKDAKSLHKSRRALGIVTILMAWSAGCNSQDQDINTFVHDWEASVSEAEYRVQPPDSLEVSSAQALEVDGEIQTVRQDGKISLRLLGDVKVAGLTPAEIGRKLESLLARYYVEPKVNVRLARSASKRFFVMGQVSQPGAFALTGRDTILTALAQANPTFIAWKSNVKLIRPSHEPDKRYAVTIDAERIMERGKLEQNVLLQEGDILYVPPTPLGWVGLRLQEFLYPAGSVTQTISTPTATDAAVDGYGSMGARR
jgi:polysaccharide export outer membrane protein